MNFHKIAFLKIPEEEMRDELFEGNLKIRGFSPAAALAAAKNIESYFFSNFFDFVKKTFIPSSGNFSFMAFIIALTFSASDFFT